MKLNWMLMGYAWCLTATTLLGIKHGQELCVESLCTYLDVDQATQKTMLANISPTPPTCKKYAFHTVERPFFKQFPILKKSIPLIELANLPTPIYKAKKLSARYKPATIYIKRDDLSGKILPDGSNIRFLGEFDKKIDRGACIS
jgi:hypothetical protein